MHHTFTFGRGLAPDPAGELTIDASHADTLIGWGGDTLPIFHSTRRLRRLDVFAPLDNFLRAPLSMGLYGYCHLPSLGNAGCST